MKLQASVRFLRRNNPIHNIFQTLNTPIIVLDMRFLCWGFDFVVERALDGSWA